MSLGCVRALLWGYPTLHRERVAIKVVSVLSRNMLQVMDDQDGICPPFNGEIYLGHSNDQIQKKYGRTLG